MDPEIHRVFVVSQKEKEKLLQGEDAIAKKTIACKKYR